MSDTDLDAIRARAERATEGPWVHLPPWKTVHPVGGEIISPNGDIADRIEAEADAEFIAHSRVDIPALIGEVERLGQELAESEREHEKTLTIMECGLDQRDEARAERDRAEATIARLEAAIRLVSPDHITPQGARIIRAALTEETK